MVIHISFGDIVLLAVIGICVLYFVFMIVLAYIEGLINERKKRKEKKKPKRTDNRNGTSPSDCWLEQDL